MAFDKRLFEAKWALGEIYPEDLPALAWDAVEAGYDGPALRRLGALEKPSGWETDRFMPAVLEELSIRSISPSEAALVLSQAEARRILAEKSDPLLQLGRFYRYWLASDYSRELSTIGNLDDAYSWSSEDMIRADAMKQLQWLAGLDIESTTSDERMQTCPAPGEDRIVAVPENWGKKLVQSIKGLWKR